MKGQHHEGDDAVQKTRLETDPAQCLAFRPKS